MLGILIYEREQWVFGFVRTKKLKLHDWNEAIGHIRDPGLAITQYWPRWNMTHIQAWPHAQTAPANHEAARGSRDLGWPITGQSGVVIRERGSHGH